MDALRDCSVAPDQWVVLDEEMKQLLLRVSNAIQEKFWSFCYNGKQKSVGQHRPA